METAALPTRLKPSQTSRATLAELEVALRQYENRNIACLSLAIGDADADTDDDDDGGGGGGSFTDSMVAGNRSRGRLAGNKKTTAAARLRHDEIRLWVEAGSAQGLTRPKQIWAKLETCRGRAAVLEQLQVGERYAGLSGSKGGGSGGGGGGATAAVAVASATRPDDSGGVEVRRYVIRYMHVMQMHHYPTLSPSSSASSPLLLLLPSPLFQIFERIPVAPVPVLHLKYSASTSTVWHNAANCAAKSDVSLPAHKKKTLRGLKKKGKKKKKIPYCPVLPYPTLNGSGREEKEKEKGRGSKAEILWGKEKKES
jgi:hypothetical protein